MFLCTQRHTNQGRSLNTLLALIHRYYVTDRSIESLAKQERIHLFRTRAKPECTKVWTKYIDHERIGVLQAARCWRPVLVPDIATYDLAMQDTTVAVNMASAQGCLSGGSYIDMLAYEP